MEDWESESHSPTVPQPHSGLTKLRHSGDSLEDTVRIYFGISADHGSQSRARGRKVTREWGKRACVPYAAAPHWVLSRTCSLPHGFTFTMQQLGKSTASGLWVLRPRIGTPRLDIAVWFLCVPFGRPIRTTSRLWRLQAEVGPASLQILSRFTTTAQHAIPIPSVKRSSVFHVQRHPLPRSI